MSDGKAFTICFLRYSKADMSTNTPEALKMAFGDILDEMMGTLSVWNEEDQRRWVLDGLVRGLQQCLRKLKQVKEDSTKL